MFRLSSEYSPSGDQPQAIAALTTFVREGRRHMVLRGVTGSGKTYSIANVVANVDRPTLVISPNKTLAAQLFSEFRAFFPSSAVEYFVSYYDYYQPEAYIPQSDTYIEKDALINDEIDRMRHSATKSLLERRDVLVVASVSCIYGIGKPDTYQGLHLELGEGEQMDRDEIIRRLVAVQYERNDYDFHRGTFRVRGDVIEVFPANEESIALRIELFGDVIDAISRIDPLRGAVVERIDRVHIYPASHYVTEAAQLERAFVTIQEELGERLAFLRQKNRLLEAQRLEQRTIFDMEMLRELGFCHGIENYSRHLTGHRPGEAPPTLIDYLPKDALIIIDESHVAVPQIRGMYYGDRSRKEALVEYGFRMPSAFDNRPLTFDEFTQRTGQTIYVSATPSTYELELAADALAEQVIRPTGLTDPKITVRPAKDQVDDLLAELRAHADRDERVLVTTLTKRMAEDLTEYYQQLGLRVRYLHSDIDPGPRRGHPRPAAGQVRRPHRDQPAPRGARHPRGVPGGDPGRRQGGLPALGDLADPDLRARGAQRQRRGHHVRRPRHRVDGGDDPGDRAPARAAARLQRRARHHAGVDQVVDPRAAPDGLRARLLHGAGRGARRRDVRVAGGPAGAHRRARSADEGGGQAPRLRARRRAARPAQVAAQAAAQVSRGKLVVVVRAAGRRGAGAPPSEASR